jgi:hypothetical protein
VPDAELVGLEVVAVRGEAVGVASLDCGGFAMEEGSIDLGAVVWAGVGAGRFG